jgi:hypothetical protein
MYTVSPRKISARSGKLFCLPALVCGLAAAFVFAACETGSDSNATIPLAGPRSVQVTAKNESLVLQWTKVAPAQGVVPYYEVYFSAAANPGGAEKWGTVESDHTNLVRAAVTGLVNYQTWYVWVKAIFPDLGQSDFSPTMYGVPVPPPGTPGPVTVVPGEGMLEITWEAVKDAYTYEVYYRPFGAGAAPPAETPLVTVSEPGAVIFNLSNGANYTIWVRSRNTAGDSPAYSQGTGTPQAATSPPSAAPGGLTVTPGADKLTLTWNHVPGVPAYKIYYGTTNDINAAAEYWETVPAEAVSVRADITGLANGTLYYVWVKSWNSRGTSGPSPAASGTPQPKPPIVFTNYQFELGRAAAEFIFAQDLPPSVFFPEGRPNTDRLTRVQETALGNLFTDGAAWYVRKQYPAENIDFVFLNGSYIDNFLPAGLITTGGLAGIIDPDGRLDKLMFLTLTGAQLKLFFDEVAGVIHTGRGSQNTGFFGMVSKEVRYTLQYYKPPEGTSPPLTGVDREPYWFGDIKPGTLKINGADIVDSRSYRICTTDYLGSGVYYTTLYAGTNKRLTSTPYWHAVAEYIYDQGTVTPKLDGRVKIEGGVPLPPPWIPGDKIYTP